MISFVFLSRLINVVKITFQGTAAQLSHIFGVLFIANQLQYYY